MKVRFSIPNNDGELFKLASIFPILAKKIIKSPQEVFFFCFLLLDPRIVAVNVNATTKCKT